MAKAAASHHVHCYHCGHRIEVGRRTMSTSCPGCSKPVIVEDIVVKTYKAVVNVETCGKLIVPKRGRVVAQRRVVAHGGIEVEGSLQCGEAISAGPVTIAAKAEWKGDLRAISLTVAAGAKIFGGYFNIPHDPLAEYRQAAPPQPEPEPKPKPASAATPKSTEAPERKPPAITRKASSTTRAAKPPAAEAPGEKPPAPPKKKATRRSTKKKKDENEPPEDE